MDDCYKTNEHVLMYITGYYSNLTVVTKLTVATL